MGLYKRNTVWWMSLMYQGEQIRRSTGTTDKRVAEAIYAKVKVKLVEGRFFDQLEEKERTFRELMDRYLQERSATKAAKSARRDRQCLSHLLPVLGDKTLVEVTPKALAS